MVSDEAKNGTLKNEVYARLRQSIIMGHRQPGDKIDVRAIAKEHGTSITPIREALQMLQHEGLVTIKPHSGYLITSLTLKQMRDLFEVREVLEMAAIERAARRISDEQITELGNVYAGYSGDDDDSYARYTYENRQFHCLIAEATGNRELAELVAHVHDRLARFMVMRRAGQTMEHTHARIIEALRAHDPQMACQAMLEELTDTRETVLDRVIQEQGETWHIDRRG